MLSCFSCCRRQKKEDDEEQRPLLSASSDPLKPPRTPLERVADVFAALHADKLPTQRQVDTALRRLKNSGLFNPDKVDGDFYKAGEELRKVIDDAMNVIDVLLQIGMEKNYDDRLQDVLYNMRLLSKPINVAAPGEVHANTPLSKLESVASAVPSSDEVAADAAAFISSLRDILFVTLTSSAFRLILSDLLSTLREIVAQSAEKVKLAAATVKNVAETVEVDMRSAGTVEHDIELPHEPVSESVSVKNTLLGRFEDILRQAQSSPRHNASLRTLLFLLRKYASRIKLASDTLSQNAAEAKEDVNVEVSLPIIVPDPRFLRILKDIKVLLERFAGRQSLDPLLAALSDLISNVSKAAGNGASSEAQLFFDKVGAWLDRALSDRQFASSRAGRESASRLFDDGQALLTRDADLSENVDRLLEEADKFANAIASDRTSTNLLNALDLLQKDTTYFIQESAKRGRSAAVNWNSTLIRLLIGWALPRILRVIHTIPMPRVEYVQRRGDVTQLAVALDALLLEAEEALVPDVLHVQEWAEIRVELDERLGAAELTNPNARLLGTTRESANEPSESTALLASVLDMHDSGPNPPQRQTQIHSGSRIRLHIDGLRLAIRDVGFYALYSATSWLGYSDEGFASAEIGRPGVRGEGLSIDLELEVDSDANGMATEQNKQKPLYRVVDVRTAVPGLALHLAHTRHWIINFLLVPLVGPVGRLVVPSILNSQIRGALEKLEEFLRDLKHSAEENSAARGDAQLQHPNEDAGLGDWWNALLEKFRGNDMEEDTDLLDDSDEDELEVYTESYIETNLKGVVHRTIEQREPSPGANAVIPSSTEDALAIGLGAQLLPGHVEPADAHRTTPSDVVRDAACEAREAVDGIEDAAKNAAGEIRRTGERGVRSAVETRHAIEDAQDRFEIREGVERRKRGWRSRAFDLS